MKWTDKDIDKLYSESSERLAFEYKKGYWDEFDAQLSEVQDAEGTKTPLSDAEIDSMYAASSSGLAFDFKNEYWNEFSASLPQGVGAESPRPALTDTEIDALYAKSAAGLSFNYTNAYWKEFNASLPKGSMAAPKPALTDLEIDAMYAASAAGLSFDYNNAYWKDFNASFPADAVLTDNGIDQLYQESASDLAFEYQPSYWEEFKGRIRRQRRPDFLWFATAYSFVGVLGVMAFMNANSVSDSKAVTANSNKIETRNEIISNSQLKQEYLGTSTNSNAISNLVSGSIINSGKNGNLALNSPSTVLLSASHVIDPIVLANVPIVQSPFAGPVLPVAPELPIAAQNLVVPATPLILPSQGGEIRPTGNNTNSPSTNGTFDGRNLIVNVVDPNGSKLNDPKDVNSREPLSMDQLATVEIEEVKLPYGSHDPLAISRSLPVPLPGSPLTFNRGAFVLGYVQGLGGLSQSLVTPSDQISNSFGIGIGMEVNKGNFTLNFGVNTLVENHNDLVLNRTAKVYGFGSDVFQFNIDYKQMYMLEAMIGVGYNLGRHRIDLGVRPSFVMSSRVRIEEIGSSTTEFATDGDYNESRDVFGFMDGIHRFGIKPTIGYMFKVSPSISLGANVGVELMPSINENFINGVNNTLPLDGQIYIRKTLSFRKK